MCLLVFCCLFLCLLVLICAHFGIYVFFFGQVGFGKKTTLRAQFRNHEDEATMKYRHFLASGNYRRFNPKGPRESLCTTVLLFANVCLFLYTCACLCPVVYCWAHLDTFVLAESNNINEAEFTNKKGLYGPYFVYLFFNTFINLPYLKEMVLHAQVCALACHYVHFLAQMCSNVLFGVVFACMCLFVHISLWCRHLCA